MSHANAQLMGSINVQVEQMNRKIALLSIAQLSSAQPGSAQPGSAQLVSKSQVNVAPQPRQEAPRAQVQDKPSFDTLMAALGPEADDILIEYTRSEMFQTVRVDLRGHGGAKLEWCNDYVEQDFNTADKEKKVRMSLNVGEGKRHVLTWRFEQGNWRVTGFE